MRIVMALLAMAAVGWAQAVDEKAKEEPKKEEVKKDEPKKAEKKADGIVVTAERIETERRLSPETYSIIPGRDIEIRQNRDVHESLRFVPGVHVAETAGKGGLTSLFIRGGESDHALILVDGVEVNSDGGGIDLAIFTNDGVRGIEVVRGAGSSLWGADAMSGTVQLFTERGEGPPRAWLSAEAGNHDTFRERLGFEVGNEEFGLNIALSRFDRGNGQRYLNSGYENTTAVARFDYALGEYTSIRANVRFISEVAGQYAVDPGPRLTTYEDHDGEKQETDFIGGLEVVQRIMDGWSATLRLQRFDEDVRFDDLDVFQYDSTSKFARTKLGAQTDASPIDTDTLRLVLTAGGEWEQEELATSDSFSGGLGVNQRRHSKSGYAQAKLEAWDRLAVTLSGRIDKSSAYRTAYTGKFGASYDVKETGTRPHASISNGIKTPTMVEVFSTNPFFIGNRRLRPELSRTYDIGVEQRVWGDHLLFDVTYFENRMRRLVEFLGGVPAFQNAGNAVAYGVELQAAVKPVDFLRFDAGYTYQRTRVTHSSAGGIVFQEHDDLIRRPHHEGYAGATVELFYTDGIPKDRQHDHPRFSASVRGRYVGRRDDVIFFSFPASPARVKNRDYMKFDLAAEYWILDRNLRVFGEIQNLFDRTYEDVVGYPNDGFTFTVGLEAALDLAKVFGVGK